MIKNFFNKLSIQISAIIIICGTLGVATFCLLYAGKESFFEFTQNLGVISENTELMQIILKIKLLIKMYQLLMSIL